MLRRLRDFRTQLRDDLSSKRFAADDINMQRYNHLAGIAITFFPDDKWLAALKSMPDGDPALGGVLGLTRPPTSSFVTERILANVENLLLRLDMKFGVWMLDEDDAVTKSTASAHDILQAERTAQQNSPLVEALERLTRQQQAAPKVDERDFAFVRDAAMRGVLVLDYGEAQRAFVAQTYKSAAALAAGVVEGMLTDLLQWPDIEQLPTYEQATRKMLSGSGSGINWKRASLFNLQETAGKLELFSEDTCRLAQAAANFRDTIHPYNESRNGVRVRREEAELLLLLTQVVYRDIAARASGTS